ncbi:hypothetical protein QWY84_02355 [Aquisalimonas lutea]|uniref:hypothetical protein n=1 Tax=Aquisalimonas lutea TaxID=1327750 RepID=UPI0025B5DBD3|nr:hypothetical protein [Aquisalimonas lutea]MDN3516441.1 hypothetical protein [Aquisalimonas lutea]
MHIRVVTASLLMGAIASSTAVADTTRERLIDDGFAAAPIEPTTVVHTVAVDPRSAGLAEAIQLGLAQPETRVVSSSEFMRISDDGDLSATQEQLRKLGFAAETLGFRAGLEADSEAIARSE